MAQEVRPGVVTPELAALLNDALRRLDILEKMYGAPPIFVTKDSAGVVVAYDPGAPTTQEVVTDVQIVNCQLLKTTACISGTFTVQPGSCNE